MTRIGPHSGIYIDDRGIYELSSDSYPDSINKYDHVLFGLGQTTIDMFEVFSAEKTS